MTSGITSTKAVSAFSGAEYIPPDSIFDVTRRYNADVFPDKVNLGQGAYRDENGKPWILPSVRQAGSLLKDDGHEYLPITGLSMFCESAVDLVFHGTSALSDGRVASCQSVSGTGALLLAGLSIKKALGDTTKRVYITDPTWSNHDLLFSSIGFTVETLPYYNYDNNSLDFDKYLAAIRAAEEESIVVLHACAHNPTGCDPTHEQWKQIADAVADHKLLTIFDAAYLGFNSGSVDVDSWAIRYFIEDRGLEAFVCMSFAKSMGLYGERVGLVAAASPSKDISKTIGSILANVQRATISNPPLHGALLAGTVLGTQIIAAQWKKDLLTMSSRIMDMRKKLVAELERLETPGNWSHLVKQTGMFGYLGLGARQVKHLEEAYHIYMAETSRISIAGLNDGNIEYVAKAVSKTVCTII